jgi:hypothetical protein
MASPRPFPEATFGPRPKDSLDTLSRGQPVFQCKPLGRRLCYLLRIEPAGLAARATRARALPVSDSNHLDTPDM